METVCRAHARNCEASYERPSLASPQIEQPPHWNSVTRHALRRHRPCFATGALVFREVNGFWAALVLVLDIWAIVNIFQSNTTTGKKALWTALVIILPVLGFIIWLIAGPKSPKKI